MLFQDHYSAHADAYARHRPRYPDELFAWLASLVAERRVAWDAGTGSGQVAVALAEHFERVVASDASADQLAHAAVHERVAYHHQPADRLPLPPASVDLVTAGAAAHWFELEGFYREVRRVGREGGVVALFSYGPRDVADVVGPVVHRFQEEVLAGFWPERIQYVHDRYATLPFPFPELAAPPFVMTAHWTLADLVAFLETWSASQRYFEQHGRRATEAVLADLVEVWGDPAERRAVRCPLFLRVGRIA